MASHAPHFGRASALPLSAVLRAIPSYPRPVIERLVARLIDHLDEQDGDLDLEANGDELDGSGPEEDAWFEQRASLFYMDALRLAGTPDDAEEDDPDEDGHDTEYDDDGDCGEHGVDQRIAAVGHGYYPWDIDAGTWAGGAR